MKIIKVFVLFSLLISINVFALGHHEPTGVIKGDVILIQADDSKTTIEARMAVWKLDNHLFTFQNMGAYMLPKDEVPVLKNLKSFFVPFSLNDIPGSIIYIVKMADDAKENSYWFRTYAEKSNTPCEEFIFLNTSVFKKVKDKTGTTFQLPDTPSLKPGRYAVFIPNNQYVWDFAIEGVVVPEPAKSSTTNTTPPSSNDGK